MGRPTSILRNVAYYMIGFGILTGFIFPVYANFFVKWKPGLFIYFSAGCIIAGFFVGLCSFWILKIVIISRISTLASKNSEVASGNLDVSFKIESSDKLGEAFRNIDSVVGSFADALGIIAGISDKIKLESRSMQTMSRKIKTATEHIAAFLEDTTGSIAQINESIQYNSKESVAAGENFTELSTATDKDRELARHMVSAVNNIMASGKNISDYIEIAEGISLQTNILAINASIEAARAGSHGSGFSVVADEIRKLSMQSNAAASQIKQFVANNHKNISDVANWSAATESALGDLSHTIKSSRTVMETIGRVSKEQSFSVSQVKESMSRISLLTSENRSLYEQMDEMVGKLQSISTELAEYLTRFNLPHRSEKRY